MPFRGQFTVDAPEGERWELALERLAAGDSIVVRDVSLQLEQDALRVTVASAWWNPERVTKPIARNELARAVAKVEDLLQADERIRQLVGERERVFELVCDYELGRVFVCTLNGDQLVWAGGE